MRNRSHISLLTLGLLLSLQPQEMYAGSFVSDMWNVVTDPFKIGKASATLSQSAERSLIQLQALEGIANAHVSDRLEQIRSILREALNGTDKIVQDATLQMLGLEQQINQDALDFLYKTQCAAEVAATATMQRGFAELITNLRKANPGVKILGVKLAELSADEVTITDPDQAYVSTKDVLIEKADKEWTDDTPAFEILS
ncbi:MAG: hypothetical protein HZC06_08090, partial [Methylocystis sp.]|nr:hypothetical protein [Methylocystis sp.]